MTRSSRVFHLSSLVYCFFCLLVLSGCAAKSRFSGISSPYLSDVDTTKKIKNLPFDHSWVWATDLKPTDYTAVYVKPVRIDTLSEESWLNSMSPLITSREDFLTKAKAVADYFHEQFIEQYNAIPDHRYKMVNAPGPKVMTVELVLTELEFGHPAAVAGTWAVPVPGAGAALSTVTEPHAAFALRVTDSRTGKLLATAADRKFPPMRIVDVNKFTISSSIREICSNWGGELADGLHQGRFGKEVERRGRFSILPW